LCRPKLAILERQKIKKKKKVARQFISFDDDDSSVLSTSVPSSSSSISSDSNSANDNQSSKSSSKYHLKDIVEEKKAASKSDKMSNDADNRSAIKRTLSIETSGSREKFNSEVPETLTPISHSEIGELTPVSVEINKHFESPDVSDEILEVPTDISEVLTAVETRNKEELKKKQDKIETLLKENEILKDQVKKYVSAIQMLQKDDESLQTALENLGIPQQPDYKGEAKLFEKKLVQVANGYKQAKNYKQNKTLQASVGGVGERTHPPPLFLTLTSKPLPLGGGGDTRARGRGLEVKVKKSGGGCVRSPTPPTSFKWTACPDCLADLLH
jgi:sorting nexin-29